MPFQRLYGESPLTEGRKKKTTTGFDLTTSQGLRDYATSQGINLEEKEKKLSILQRLGRGLSALEPVNAFYEAKYEGKNWAIEYVKDIFQEAGSALTGREFQDEGRQKRTFKDVLIQEGWRDEKGKINTVDLVGFAGDVVFDPSTWFGGAIAKGVGKGVGTTAKGLQKVGMRIAPTQTVGKEIGTAARSFFAPETLMTKGLPDEMAELDNTRRRIMAEKAGQFGEAFKKLPKSSQRTFAQSMIDFNKKFGQTRELTLIERERMLTKQLNQTISQIKKETRQLKQNSHLTRETLKDIQKIERGLAENTSKLREDLSKFLSDESVQEIGIVSARVSKIPREYLNLAFQARKSKTFQEFQKTDVHRQVLDLELKGELASAGFGKGDNGVENFYKYAKGDYQPAKIVERVTEIEAKQLGKQQEDIFKAGRELGEKQELDLPSYIDSIRATQKKVDDLLDLKDEIADKAMKNFVTVTQTLVKEFDAVAPERIFSDPAAVKFYVDEFAPMLGKQREEVARITGMKEDMLMKAYFPLIDNRKIRDFMNAGVRVSKEGGVKRMRGIIEDKNILKNAPEAYARRAAQIEIDGITRTTIQRWGKRYGRPLEDFADEREALQAGYKLLKEKGSLGKEVAWIPEWDHKFINEIFDPSYQMLDLFAKNTGFDWMTRAFKIGVTGFFAPFHVRNFVSGIIQNFEVLGPAALRGDNIALGQKLTIQLLKQNYDGTLKFGKETIKVRSLLHKIQRRFGYSSQYLSDYGWEGGELAMKKSSVIGKPVEYVRNIGNYIEMQQKITAVVTALRKGYGMDEALHLARKAGFDYSRLSPFEKHVMRRLIPFYSFSRNNVALQFSTLAKNPQRLGTLTKAGRALGTPTDIQEGDKQKYPDWMMNRFVADFGVNQYGLPQVISGFGTPLEEQAELFERGPMAVLSRLNPLLKVPLEKTVGKDFFYERDLQDVYGADEYQKAPKFLRDWLKLVPVEVNVYKGGVRTGEKHTQYRADADRLHYARNMFTSRGFSYLHTLFGEEELTQGGRALRALTGVKTYELDEEEIQFFEERDTMKDYISLLRKLGILKVFEKAYIPKSE